MSAILFRDDLPLSETMAFESPYHPNLQMEVESKQYLLNIKGPVFLWMFVDGELAGETYGIPLAAAGENLPGLTALTPAEKQESIYCYSNTLLPPFHRHGLGAVLKSKWLSLAAQKGFTTVYGHARPGPSQALNASFGAEFLQTFPNWYSTGEDYKLYRLALPASRLDHKKFGPSKNSAPRGRGQSALVLSIGVTRLRRRTITLTRGGGGNTPVASHLKALMFHPWPGLPQGQRFFLGPKL